MSNKGPSRFIPNAVLDAYKPLLVDAWEMAAAFYMVAVWLLVISGLIAGFTFSFRGGLDSGPWAGGLGLPLLVPVTLAVLVCVLRARSSQASPRGLWMLDATLTMYLLLALAAIAIGVIGVFAAFGDDTFGVIVADILAHLGDIAFGGVGAVWSMHELAGLRKLTPVTTASVISTPVAAAPAAPTAEASPEAPLG